MGCNVSGRAGPLLLPWHGHPENIPGLLNHSRQALARLEPGALLAAMIESFGGSEEPLAGQMRKLIAP